MTFKKLLIIAISFYCFCFFQSAFGQNRAIENFYKKQFYNAPPSKYKDLIPFYKNEKWGYIDKRSKKILVPAIFSLPRFFNPNAILWYQNNSVELKQTGEFIKVEEELPFVVDVTNEKPIRIIDTKVKSSENGFNGFVLNEVGQLVSYSSLYKRNEDPDLNVKLFKYKNHYYGIVADTSGAYGIIDSLGNPLKGFEFNYKEIIINSDAKDTKDIWFFVKKNSDNYSLISTSGEIKCENEIFDYPFSSSSHLDMFGFVVLYNKEVFGIFDRYNMKWIKPETKDIIEGLDYSSNTILNTDKPKQRDKANIYYFIGTKGKKYFVDLSGNIYVPKN